MHSTASALTQLENGMESKPFSITYISLDKDFAKWKNAFAKHGLKTKSYRIYNEYSASFLVEINLNEIPGNLLFSPDGRSVISDAPHPAD